MTETSVYEQRRYTALLLQHPAVTGLPDLRRYLPSLTEAKKLTFVKGSWSGHRVVFRANRSHYPRHLVDPDERRSEAGYAHDLYVGIRSVSGGTPLILIASPYTRLLQKVAGDLRQALPVPAPRYFAVDMPRVYSTIGAGRSGFVATKVTMQMLNEPALELVSLAGRNPLNSNLHAAIENVASPYSIRTEIAGASGPCRVNTDRHGNLWWYQTEEGRFVSPLEFVDALLEWDALKPVRTLPLARDQRDDE